jgi:hypothetical protein
MAVTPIIFGGTLTETVTFDVSKEMVSLRSDSITETDDFVPIFVTGGNYHGLYVMIRSEFESVVDGERFYVVDGESNARNMRSIYSRSIDKKSSNYKSDSTNQADTVNKALVLMAKGKKT